MKKRLRFKIMAIFGLLFMVLAANSIWAVVNFDGLSDSIEGIMQDNYRSVVAAQNMIVAIERQDSAELSYMFARDESASRTFFSNEKVFYTWLARAEDNITEPGEEEILTKISELYTQYVQQFYQLVEIQNSQGTQQARDFYYEQILPLFDSIKATSRDLLTINQNAMLALRNRAQDTANNAIYSTITVSAITIVGGLILATYLANKLITPIYSLIDKTKKIADGDYSQALDVVSDDEIGVLAHEFNVMTEKLKSYEQLNIIKMMQEKQKAEAIVESISDGLIVTDRERRIILVNRAAERVFDIRENDVLNRHLLEVIDNKAIFELVEKAQRHDSPSAYKSYVDITMTIDDITKHYRVDVKPIVDRQQEDDNIGVVILIQDITKLKEVDNLKSDFVSTVAHEFRTPLTSISMAANLLLEGMVGPINDQQRELLEAVREDQERLSKLVSELLDLSRMESGKIEMDIANHDIKDIVEHAVRPFHRQIEERKAQLDVDIRPHLQQVKADFNKISWVLSNIVGNALRYIPTDGTGKITITAKQTANKMLVSVADNGKGIPEEFQKKIFEKFIQVKDREGEPTGGTGLGLAISKEIITAHGGEIWVNSRLGEGSTFFFTLRLAAR